MFNAFKKRENVNTKNDNLNAKKDFTQLSLLMKKAIGRNNIAEFANKCGIPDSARYIHNITNGKIPVFPEVEFLQKIAYGSEFRVTFDEFKNACGYNSKDNVVDLRGLKVRRGWICLCDYGNVLDSEMGGIRPSLIIQNNKGNAFSGTTFIAPITSQLARKYQSTHVRIGQKDGLALESEILIEQMRTVTKRRLLINGYIQVICEVSEEIMRQVEIAIIKQTGIANVDLNENVIDIWLDRLNEHSEKIGVNNYKSSQVSHNTNTQVAFG